MNKDSKREIKMKNGDFAACLCALYLLAQTSSGMQLMVAAAGALREKESRSTEKVVESVGIDLDESTTTNKTKQCKQNLFRRVWRAICNESTSH